MYKSAVPLVAEQAPMKLITDSKARLKKTKQKLWQKKLQWALMAN
jgi:hypothetical protein